MAEGEKFVLSEEGRRVWIKGFQRFCKEGEKVIEKSRIMEALNFVGVITTPEDAKKVVEYFDSNNDDYIQIEELLDNWQSLVQHSINGDELMKAFQTIDKNGDGYIKEAELKFILTQTGQKWKSNEAEKCLQTLKKFDQNLDGKFSYPEFVQMFTENMYPFKKPDNVERKDITQEYEQVKESQQEGNLPA